MHMLFLLVEFCSIPRTDIWLFNLYSTLSTGTLYISTGTEYITLLSVV